MAQEEGSSTIEWGRSTAVVAKGNPSAREIQTPAYKKGNLHLLRWTFELRILWLRSHVGQIAHLGTRRDLVGHNR